MHKLKQVKTKPRPKTKSGGLKWGVRRAFNVMKGYGGMPRAKAAERHKTSIHPTFRYTCDQCGKSSIKRFRRAKKISQV